jgi:hypothetical protein
MYVLSVSPFCEGSGLVYFENVHDSYSALAAMCLWVVLLPCYKAAAYTVFNISLHCWCRNSPVLSSALRSVW